MDLTTHRAATIERTTIADYVRSSCVPQNYEHFLVGPRAVSTNSSTTFRDMGFGPDSELVKIVTAVKDGKVQPWMLRIGRKEADTEFTIDAPVISTKHAIIYGDADSTHIIDLGSTNGTYVNGLKIATKTPRQLLLSATIRFGPEQYKLDGGLVLQNFPWAYHSAEALSSQLVKYSGKKTA